MKNKYNLQQVAQKYCEEIGFEAPFMYDYLVAVFSKNKQSLEDYDKMLAELETTSEFFPECKNTLNHF